MEQWLSRTEFRKLMRVWCGLAVTGTRSLSSTANGASVFFLSLDLFFWCLACSVSWSSVRSYCSINIQMDPGRLPAYRSSYLLRFHPYPRTKLSARERVAVSAWEPESPEPPQINSVHRESDIPFTPDQAIRGTEVHNEIQLCQRRLSVSSLVDLVLLCMKKVFF
ncbi:hypothetical protein HD554DRAFT_1046384 [Boletus coccyginus]|nr:hypothetical protein HD554DRAFT_1433858 [Boletus coccyginus]KAI9567045.1 hypothetical protein HD554DRAFT_1046384 [Boletus coccyginus]